MGEIHIKRIEQKIIELYGSLINMDDYQGKPSNEIKKALNSRGIAAHAIFMQTGIMVQNCAESITDGFQDMGIDAVYNDTESKELFLVQAKWISDGNGSPAQGDVNKFINGFKRLLNLDFSNANSKLLSKLSDIEFALMDTDYKINLVLVYTGSQGISDEVSRDMNQLIKDMNDTSEVVSYTVINQKKLYDSISYGADATPINIDDIDLRDWGKITEPYAAYYGCISAETIVHWWNEFGNRLFAKNIRLFKGNSDANEGMIKTLSENPKDFWYFNNGIKVLCDEFSKKPLYGDDRTVGLFNAKGVSIVNGAQTVGAIGTVFSKNLSKAKDAKIFVQFISLESTPPDYDVLVTRLSNTQNRIDGKDFAALDPEQERIRRDMWMDNINYIYKGSIKGKASDVEITMEEAAVALACFDSDIKLTTLSKSNVGAFFDDIAKPPYITLFNNKTNSIQIINIVRETREIEVMLQKKVKSFDGRKKQMLVHGNRFLTHMTMQLQNDRYRLHQSIIDKRSSMIPEDLIDRIIDITYDGIQDKYPENYINSLFKNNTKCEELKKYVSSKIIV